MVVGVVGSQFLEASPSTSLTFYVLRFANHQSMPNTPGAISAIITTYNYARFVGPAIDSVLAQSTAPAEIVVVDDGSTDETAAVVERYLERGVRYVKQQRAGAGAARNRGLAETGGELVAFLDAD